MAKSKCLVILLVFWGVLMMPKSVMAVVVKNINFETGDLSQFDYSITELGGTMAVTPAAALGGTKKGLAVSPDNSLLGLFGDTVISPTPHIRARFYVDPNSCIFGNHSIFGLAAYGGTYVIMLGVNLEYDGVYHLNANFSDDSNNSVLWDTKTVSDGPHYVEFDMVRATTSVSSDGTASWWVDGVGKSSVSGIDNYNTMNDANIGAFLGSRWGYGTTSNCSYYLDQLVINNDGSQIGPVSNGGPSSSKYKLEGFAFGNAGGAGVGSSNYSLEGNLGEVASNRMTGVSYDLGAGLMFVQQANIPMALLTNPGNYSDKLHLEIDRQGNPPDTNYAVAISPDNFITTYYVKSDHTIGATLTAADYVNYDLWGGGSGIDIIGLTSNTTYKVKVKAMQGKFTETGYGPLASAATVAPALTFEIDVAPTDIQTTPPYIINMGDLNPGSLVTSNDHVWVSLTTNTSNGGSVFVYGKNGGLYSVAAGYKITAVSGDLTSLSSGFGAQGVGATQTSGGPFTIDVGYTGSGGVVGITDTLVRQIFLTNGPVVGGRGSFVIKAKSDNGTPAAGDYAETLTVIAAANY